MRQQSVADEVKEILELSEKPLSMREIVLALDNKYDGGQISASIECWIKRGVIKKHGKDGYFRNKVYSINY